MSLSWVRHFQQIVALSLALLGQVVFGVMSDMRRWMRLRKGLIEAGMKSSDSCQLPMINVLTWQCWVSCLTAISTLTHIMKIWVNWNIRAIWNGSSALKTILSFWWDPGKISDWPVPQSNEEIDKKPTQLGFCHCSQSCQRLQWS